MHIKEQVPRVVAAVTRAGRFLRRRKRWGIVLLVTAPLALTGSLELFVLNLLGLGIGFLFIRSQVRRRRQEREYRLWLARRAEREEDERGRWLKRRDSEASQNTG